MTHLSQPESVCREFCLVSRWAAAGAHHHMLQGPILRPLVCFATAAVLIKGNVLPGAALMVSPMLHVAVQPAFARLPSSLLP